MFYVEVTRINRLIVLRPFSPKLIIRHNPFKMEDRSTFKPIDSVHHLWTDNLGLPESALDAIKLSDDAGYYPSSFKVEHLAQCSIALSALAAALFW